MTATTFERCTQHFVRGAAIIIGIISFAIGWIQEDATPTFGLAQSWCIAAALIMVVTARRIKSTFLTALACGLFLTVCGLTIGQQGFVVYNNYDVIVILNIVAFVIIALCNLIILFD